MKKRIIAIVLAILMLLPFNVMAVGGITTDTKTLTITKGSTKTFVITATNAIGDVSIKSSDTKVATVDTSLWETGMVEEGQSKTGTITVTGIAAGKTTIELTIDGATFDEEELSQTHTIAVEVVEPAEIPTTPSSNTGLKSIAVEGYELVKVDNNTYTLKVDNKVASITLSAVAEDPNAVVKGLGVHELSVGENVLEVTVTAQSGATNKYLVKVTRDSGKKNPETGAFVSILELGLLIGLGVGAVTVVKRKKLFKI